MTGLRLTDVEDKVVSKLRGCEGLTATDLQRMTHFHPATIHRVITELSECGVITSLTRLNQTPDERVTYYRLSEIGEIITESEPTQYAPLRSVPCFPPNTPRSVSTRNSSKTLFS